jgi:excisionase family DNA binding protein
MTGIPELLTVKELCGLCGVSRTTVLRWVKLGLLEGRRTPGGHHRIVADQVYVRHLLASRGISVTHD